MLDSSDAMVAEFLKRGLSDRAAFYAAFMIFDAYYTMNKPEWVNQENRTYRDETEIRFSSFFRKYEDLWKSIPSFEKMQISNGVRSRSVLEGMQMESVTIDGWLRRIKRLGTEKRKAKGR